MVNLVDFRRIIQNLILLIIIKLIARNVHIYINTIIKRYVMEKSIIIPIDHFFHKTQ